MYLAVDDDTLDEIVGEPGDGRGSRALLRTVRPKLSLGDERHFFEPVRLDAVMWHSLRTTAAAPPFLPVLALTVLAASRMDESEAVAAFNYYHRLKEVLDITFDPGPAFRDAVAQMFVMLDEWLTLHKGHFRGVSTISAHPQPAHVGYPLSQVLFRQSDRRQLTRFFRMYGLRPEDAESAEAAPGIRPPMGARGKPVPGG